MGRARDIREIVQYLAGTHDNNFILLADATVNSYDEANRVCSVTLVDGKSADTRNDARLMCTIDDGILNLPTVGSTVTVILSTFTDPLIIGYSGLDKIILKGGDLGGLAIVPVLFQKINKIEMLLNKVIQDYNAHVHPVITTGAPTGTTTTPEADSVNPLTKQSDIENTSITHGA